MCLLATLCTHSNIRTRVNTFAFTYVHMYICIYASISTQSELICILRVSIVFENAIG